MLWAVAAVEDENLPKPVAYWADNCADNRKLFVSVTEASDVLIKISETAEMWYGANGLYHRTTKGMC